LRNVRRSNSPLGDAGRLATIGIVAAVYFIGAKLGLKLAFLHPSATPVWPGTGIALASLLLLGSRAWPGIFLGAFLANLTTTGTVWTSLGIAAGNTLEGVIGAYLIGTYAGGTHVFNRWQDIFAFAALGAIASTTVSATIGVTSLALAGFAPWANYQQIWLTWWLGDAAGALIFTPLLVLWAQAPRLRWRGGEFVERAAFLVALLAVGWVVFGGVFAFSYLTVPFVIWAAFRFDRRETATVIVVLSAIAVWGTVQKHGPFVGTSPNESLLLLQTFMGLMVLVALPLASVVADNERRVASERQARREAEWAAERAARVQAVTAALSGAVTRAQVVDVVLTQGIRALGARAGWVSMLAEDGDALQLVGHAGGYPDEFVTELRRIPLTTPRPTTLAFRTGQPLFFESEASVRAQFPDLHVFYDDVARAAIPLSTAGNPLGVLVLNFPTRRVFNDDERSLMLTLAQQCAQALERAQFYEREHYVAKTLQQAFLPATLPAVPGMKIDAVYASAGAPNSEIGGDWYDVFRLPDGRIAVSVGDVVGSGVQAAVMMAQVRQSIRATALEGQSPTVVLDRAGRVLQLAYEREGMATAVFGILDPVSRTFTYANAGHPPPTVAAPGGEIQALASGGGPLGLSEAKPSGDRTVLLPPGGLLVLYTDGLIESTRNPADGEQLLIDAVRGELDGRSPRPAQTLLEHVVGSRVPNDDVAIVTISIGLDPVEELALTLPAEPASLRQVRQAVRQLAGALKLDGDQAFRILVALGEAVNNTVEHAYGAGEGEFHLRVWRDADVLRAEISDDGRWRPERQEGQGRGLGIMRALAQAIDVDRGPAGTTVRLAWSLAPTAVPQAAAPAGDAAPRQRGGGGGPEPAGTRAGPMGDYPPFRAGQFAIGELEGVPVVTISGDVDLNNAWILAEQLEAAARLDKRAVVVSLTDASFFDSTAIHVLLRFERRLATNRQRLLLAVGRDRPARRIIDLTGLSHTIPVFESAADAVAGARQGR
jgi:anti-anti-sigma factor